jgi:ABC-2 type transport system ATP-binding protein
MLELRDVEKSYGAFKAVAGVSLELRAGEVLGLLGPNGAGKSTTVALIAGLLRPDAGTVRIQGRSLAGASDPLKLAIGLVPQELALFEALPAWDNLILMAALYGLQGHEAARAAERVLAFVGLEGRARDRVATFSGGMKRRLNLAAAMLHDPPLLILDEPTVGVDPQSRNAIFDNIEALKAAGKALLYTTHYMEEAERLCDRIVIMDGGRVLAADSLQGLLRRLPATSLLSATLDAPGTGAWLADLQREAFVASASLDQDHLRIGLADLNRDAPAALLWLGARSLTWSRVDNQRPSLESVFLALTGRTLRDA